MELETPRIRLRSWQTSDQQPFARLNADPATMEFFPDLLDEAKSNALAERCKNLISDRGWGLWATELRESSTFIGFVGLHDVPADIETNFDYEIGWRIHKDYWGHGYATEAASEVIRFAFQELNLPGIVSFTSVLNTRSISLMERLGLNHTNSYFNHPNIDVEHRLSKHVLYELRRADWLRTSTDG